jgi:hypothetical protein
VSIWRIARALRPGDSLWDRVALDQRLREAAGRSLVAPHPPAARERPPAELLADAAGGPVATESDNFGALIVAALADGMASADTGGHADDY